jgi:hypothetical protein
MTEEGQAQEWIDYFSLLTHEELIRLFDTQKGDALHRLYERQFQIHYNNYKQMMPTPLAMKHGINSLFLMALDDVLMEIKASYSQLRESAMNIFRAMLLEFFMSEAEMFKQQSDPWRAFVEWVRQGNKTNFDNEYFKAKEIESDSGCFAFDIQRCFYFEVLKESGRPELGSILCEYDSILASVVDSWIKFTRHETIASGDERCTFRYEKR